MISYDNKEIKFDGCPGCAYAKHEFDLSCGMVYEDDEFTLSQDWELPIPGFMIVSPKKHIVNLEELSKEQRDDMFDLVDETISILRKNNICEKFNVIFEEKRHFHIWIMPRYEWMNEITNKSIMENIGVIFEYAKENLKNNDTFEQIQEITDILKNEFVKSNKKLIKK